MLLGQLSPNTPFVLSLPKKGEPGPFLFFIKAANPQRYFRDNEEGGKLTAIGSDGCARPIALTQEVFPVQIAITPL